MKKLGLVVAIALVAGLAFKNNDSNLEKYHKDGVDEVFYSIDPPPQRTGAPGEDNCTQCHSGSVFSASGVVTYDFSDPLDQYYPDSTYSITLSVPNNVINGFEMTILDGNALMAGTFTSGFGSSVVDSGLRQYIRQSVPNVNGWTFQWTAPPADMGNLTVYYSFNKADNSGTTLGDSIFLGQETIFISPAADLTEYQELQNDFHVSFDSESGSFNSSFTLQSASRVFLQIHDLSGRLIFTDNYGIISPASYSKKIILSNLPQSQIYIVSLFVDNYVLNRKLIVTQ